MGWHALWLGTWHTPPPAPEHPTNSVVAPMRKPPGESSAPLGGDARRLRLGRTWVAKRSAHCPPAAALGVRQRWRGGGRGARQSAHALPPTDGAARPHLEAASALASSPGARARARASADRLTLYPTKWGGEGNILSATWATTPTTSATQPLRAHTHTQKTTTENDRLSRPPRGLWGQGACRAGRHPPKQRPPPRPRNCARSR